MKLFFDIIYADKPSALMHEVDVIESLLPLVLYFD